MRRVLVIGGQGFLGSFIARGLADDGWYVTRAGRRRESGADFRLLDLERRETVVDACRDADLVVSTVRHPGLVAERVALRDGGILLHLDDLPVAERARLKREAPAGPGLVVDRSGLGGVMALAVIDLLARHPNADAVDYGFIVSLAEAAGRAGGAFVHRLLAGRSSHPTAVVELPEPFGRRRCIEAGPAVEGMLREIVGPRTVRLHIFFLPAAFNAMMLALNALRLASRLPLAAFTVGRENVPAEPSRQDTCHWVNLRRGSDLAASGFVRGAGDYRMTVAATRVFADALVPQPGGAPRRKGVFGVEEVFTLGEVAPALAAHGVTVRQRA